MTKQQAIDVLRNAAWLGNDADRDLTEKAVEMAISALEAQESAQNVPKDDLISRKTAIDGIMGQPSEPHYPSWYAEQIKKLPSAQPERKKGKCVWCSSPYRIEYYWIDKDGCTASFEDEDRHIVATGIAKYCPNCGRPLEAEDNE